MNNSGRAKAVKPPGVSTRLVLLLAAAMFINYVDRGNLATAAPLMQGEFHLSNTQVGTLLSAFYWTYAPMQLLAGWMAERLDVNRVLPAGLALWALATMLTGLAGGFVMLLGLRFLLGLGESVMYPCQCKLLALRSREQQRGKANGIMAVGQALGPAFGTLAGGLLMAGFGWRVVMVGFGAVSLLWLWPWIATTRKSPSTVGEGGPGRPPSYAVILKRSEARAACLGHFCCNYTFYFVLGWLPLFLVKSRGFSIAEMAKIGAAVYCLYALSAAVTGWASDRWIQAGQSPSVARRTFMVASCLGIAACLLLTANATPSMAIVWLLVIGIFFGFSTPMMFAIAQTLAGPQAAGKWVGLQNFVGNLAGILGPILTGWLIDRTASFGWAFVVAAGVSLLGAVVYGVMIRRIETLEWPVHSAARAARAN
jgi:MFS family permease